jgi:transcriptional regulator with XRE-family HTH domain
MAEERFNIALGGRLRVARRRRGWSLTEVEDVSHQEFKASVLGAYERGERALSVHRLHRLAILYGLSIHQLLPTESELDADSSDVVIDLDRLAGDENAAVLDRFLSSIHLMRKADASDLTVRRSDLAILNTLLETLDTEDAGT